MKALGFSHESVNCAPALNERLKGTYSYKKPPDTPYYWQMFDSDLFAQHNPSSVKYNVKCTIAPDYPASEIGFDLTTEYYRWEKGTFKKAEDVPSGFNYALNADQSSEPAAQSQGTGSAPTLQRPLTLYFPRDSKGDYGFYYFRLTASPRDLREDIKGLSTRDDRLPGEAGKTYRFLELISAITDVHFKTRLVSKASPSIFVTIDNR
jgi:hypothetical protein